MNWLRKFMYGRYGLDQLNNFLFWAYMAVFAMSLFIPEFMLLGYVIIFYTLFRMFSRNIYKRRAENQYFLDHTAGIRKWGRRQKNKWKHRKIYKYFKCPKCHKELRVPRGRGSITITCPHCQHKFDKRT